MLVGMLNSLYHSWSARRVLLASDSNGDYVSDNIGLPPSTTSPKYRNDRSLYEHELMLYEERYKSLYAAFVRSYVDTGFGVHVPLFGIAVDINDLGAIGGVASLIILFVFDYSVRREIENLHVGFTRAADDNEVAAFYDLLAMYQLLTVPRRNRVDKRERTAALPKLICVLPMVVQLIVVAHDIWTNPTGESLDRVHNDILLACEFGALILMVPLTYWTTRRLYEVDRIWDQWADVRFGELGLGNSSEPNPR